MKQDGVDGVGPAERGAIRIPALTPRPARLSCARDVRLVQLGEHLLQESPRQTRPIAAALQGTAGLPVARRSSQGLASSLLTPAVVNLHHLAARPATRHPGRARNEHARRHAQDHSLGATSKGAPETPEREISGMRGEATANYKAQEHASAHVVVEGRAAGWALPSASRASSPARSVISLPAPEFRLPNSVSS